MWKIRLVKNDAKNLTYLRKIPDVGINELEVYPRIKINKEMPQHILRRRHCRSSD